MSRRFLILVAVGVTAVAVITAPAPVRAAAGSGALPRIAGQIVGPQSARQGAQLHLLDASGADHFPTDCTTYGNWLDCAPQAEGDYRLAVTGTAPGTRSQVACTADGAPTGDLARIGSDLSLVECVWAIATPTIQVTVWEDAAFVGDLPYLAIQVSGGGVVRTCERLGGNVWECAGLPDGTYTVRTNLQALRGTHISRACAAMPSAAEVAHPSRVDLEQPLVHCTVSYSKVFDGEPWAPLPDPEALLPDPGAPVVDQGPPGSDLPTTGFNPDAALAAVWLCLVGAALATLARRPVR